MNESSDQQRTRPLALITGAGSGVGRATAVALAAAGHDVIVHWGHDPAAADLTLAEVRRHGVTATGWQADLAALDGSDTFWDAVRPVVQSLGRDRIDLLVLNAGRDDRDDFARFDAARIRQLFEVNTIAPMLILQQADRHVARGGSIVLVSSIAATTPIPTSIPYSASKAAVENLTRAMAAVLADHDIRVNAVAPGAVDTPMQTGERRDRLRAAGVLATPEAIAEVICFLAGSGARWVNGQVIRASGPLLG